MVSVGPAPLASDATGDGGQDYNWVSGRATSVVIDPADTSGNTVLRGGAYGGLWKSTDAGRLNSNPAAVTWQALIDDQPTLAVGAIALQPGNTCGNTTFACQFSPASIAAGTGATTVTLTISTRGPNQNSQSRPRLHADGIRRPVFAERRSLPYGQVAIGKLLALACALAGAFVGIRVRKGAGRGRHLPIALLCLGLAVTIELSCGGVSGGGGSPPAVIVPVAPGVPSSVYANSPGWPNQTAQFTATVSNTSNTAVTWEVAKAVGGLALPACIRVRVWRLGCRRA